MSPISRGRKKKDKQRTGSSELDRLLRDMGRRPEWFDSAIDTVLEDAATLARADGPRSLEEATTELVGDRMYEALHGGHALRFDQWVTELVAETAALTRDAVADGHPWLHGFRLLRGLESTLPEPLATRATTAIGALPPSVTGSDALQEWVRREGGVSATGEVWRVSDVYGTRMAFVAAFTYEPNERTCFLFDVDTCAFEFLADAGTFDDVDAAVTHWRQLVGEPATGDLTPVTDPDELRPLWDWAGLELGVFGHESRAVMRNWYRARRRADDLVARLSKSGEIALKRPEPASARDVAAYAQLFSAWYAGRHPSGADSECVEALAQDWLDDPHARFAVSASPHRVAHHLDLMTDWHQDDPVTKGVRELLPEWVRWCGERAGTPAPFVAAAVDVAVRGDRTVTCPGFEPDHA